MRRHGQGYSPISTAIAVLLVLTLIVCPLSVGPAFGYYAHKGYEDISRPMPRLIFKMYVPLFRLFSETSIYYPEKFDVSAIEAYFKVNQENFSDPRKRIDIF